MDISFAAVLASDADALADLRVGAAAVHAILAEADARRCELHVGALRESDANRFYVRHGFRLLRREEFDNYYVRHAA